MKQLLIIIAIIAVLVLGYFMFIGNDGTGNNEQETAEGEARVLATEVIELEEELRTIEVSATTGTMTAEEAASARNRIQTRLESIGMALSSSDSVVITAEQQAAMVATLETIKGLLTRYQDTLVAIDAIAEVTADTTNRFPGRTNSITNSFVESVEQFENQVEDSVRDYDATVLTLEVETEAHLAAVEVIDESLEEAENGDAETATSTATTTVETEVESTTTVY